MTTWATETKGSAIYQDPAPVGEVDFLFSDGADFLFSNGLDFVFKESGGGLTPTVWTLATK